MESTTTNQTPSQEGRESSNLLLYQSPDSLDSVSSISYFHSLLCFPISLIKAPTMSVWSMVKVFCWPFLPLNSLPPLISVIGLVLLTKWPLCVASMIFYYNLRLLSGFPWLQGDVWTFYIYIYINFQGFPAINWSLPSFLTPWSANSAMWHQLAFRLMYPAYFILCLECPSTSYLTQMCLVVFKEHLILVAATLFFLTPPSPKVLQHCNDITLIVHLCYESRSTLRKAMTYLSWTLAH